MQYYIPAIIEKFKLSLVLSICLVLMTAESVRAAQIEVEFDVYPYYRYGVEADKSPHFSGVIRFDSGFDGDYPAKVASGDIYSRHLVEYDEVNVAGAPYIEMYRDGMLVSHLLVDSVLTDSGWYPISNYTVSETVRIRFRDPDTSVIYAITYRYFQRTNTTETSVIMNVADGWSESPYGSIGTYYLKLLNEYGVPKSLGYRNGTGTFSSHFITATDVPEITCTGFDSPVGDKTVKVRNGRALPLKAKLFNSDLINVDGLALAAPPMLSVVRDTSEVVTEDASFVGAGTESHQFVYREDDELWQFNLKTVNYTQPGTYTVTMVSGDSTEYLITPQCKGTFIVGN